MPQQGPWTPGSPLWDPFSNPGPMILDHTWGSCHAAGPSLGAAYPCQGCTASLQWDLGHEGALQSRRVPPGPPSSLAWQALLPAAVPVVTWPSGLWAASPPASEHSCGSSELSWNHLEGLHVQGSCQGWGE